MPEIKDEDSNNDLVDNYTNGEFDNIISNPKTGDPVIKWGIILLLSILGIIGFIILFKRSFNGKVEDVYFE